MRAIHKYLVTPEGATQMPANAEILSVGEQRDDIVVWALVDVDAPTVTRRLVAVPTGYQFDDSAAPKASQFVGTVQNGALVFHVFDAGEA